MNARLLLPFLLLLSVLGGCTKDAQTSKQPDPATSSPAPATGEGDGEETPTPAGPSIDDIPQELRHAAFEYYGLANDKPKDMEVRQPGGELSGGQVFRLKEIADGKAIFEYEHTGGLAGQGTFTISLEKDGIYSVGSSVATVNPHELEMPADIAVGKTWTSNTKFQPNDGQPGLEQNATNKAVRIEPVTTKARKYDEALLVESKGPAKIGTESFDMSTKMWFVKGKGIVKMENTRTPKGGKPITVTIEATS